MMWYGATTAPYDDPLDKHHWVAKYIDEESREDAFDVEATQVSKPFEAEDKQEALAMYLDMVKSWKWGI